jgi:rfaE bifunctional protein nucleotidyltransferase chain/domain
VNFRRIEDKIVTEQALQELCSRLHNERKRIVTTNGCFDLLHWGHIQYLFLAKQLGDCLIVGINSDRSVKTLEKGGDRPLVAEKYRALQIAGLESVDWVYIFDESTPELFLSLVQPHLHVKGGDYQDKRLPESKVVENAGGKVVLLPLEPGFSTTALLDKIRRKPL